MFWDGVGFVSVLGDRIIEGGPYVANVDNVPFELSAAEWNALRQELIELRARVAPPMGACVIEGHGGHPAWECNRKDAVGSPPMVPGLTAEEGLAEVAARSCVVCGARVLAGMLECLRCAGSEDAAAKRATDL